MTGRRTLIWCVAAIIGVSITSPVTARDAAFIQPNAAGNNAEEEAVKVEPKNEIDIGDSTLNMARRTTLFFVNESSAPVQVEQVTVNSDANVAAEIANDDCTKQGTIAPQSRCSVEVQVTPSSAGTWSVEALMTHTGAGRIARAKITGKTAGSGVSDKKETGLSVNSKEASPVNFGDLAVGGKAVRSALMVNDSPDSITIYSIDVIEADNGLKVLDQGCEADMELKPGESCPVTLVWAPAAQGQISTDLIIRHSGRLGFAVVPVRGSTKGNDADLAKSDSSKVTANPDNGKKLPLPPGADDLDKLTAGKIPPVVLETPEKKLPAPGIDALHLIGTVGNRAVLQLLDGTTTVVGIGDEVPLGDDKKAKVVAINAKSAELSVGGKKKKLILEASSDLIAKATAAAAASTAADQKKTTASKDANSSSSGSTRASSAGAPVASAASGASR